MDEPSFQGGKLAVENHKGVEFELDEKTWNEHILGDHSRNYYKDNFGKVIETIKNPDRILQSKKDIDVQVYEKRFTDFFLSDNAVLGLVYNYVVVRVYDNRVLTFYPSKNPKNGDVIWTKKT